MPVNNYNSVSLCSQFGDKLSFRLEVSTIFIFVNMYINDVFACSKIFSGNMKRDINLMVLQRYEE